MFSKTFSINLLKGPNRGLFLLSSLYEYIRIHPRFQRHLSKTIVEPILYRNVGTFLLLRQPRHAHDLHDRHFVI